MWTTRPYKEQDFNFIANSYLKSYRSGPEAKHMVNDVYFPEYKDRLQTMLKDGKVTIVCAESDEDQIIGYAIHSSLHAWGILHYVYVKYPFRRMGIARLVINTVLPDWGVRMTLCTHLPKNWSELSKKHKLFFDPKYSRETK